MGFPIPKQLQDEIQRAVPHLRIIIPAAAAVAWFFGKVFNHGHHPEDDVANKIEEDQGEPIDVEIPTQSSKGPKLPFSSPPPLKTTLIKITIPTSIDTLWGYLMSNQSETLVRFHEKLGDRSVSINTWRRRTDGRRLRTLRFIKPLQSAIGPKECLNIEQLAVNYINKDGFVVTTSCTSQGVPFSSNFKNYVQWVAMPSQDDAKQTVLHVTGECKFHTPIWGPLKGTIANESIKGMQKAYATLSNMIGERFGVVNGSVIDEQKTKGLSAVNVGSSDGFMGYLQSSQSNPAVMLVVMAMFIILWRMALLDTLALTVLRRLASAGGK